MLDAEKHHHIDGATSSHNETANCFVNSRKLNSNFKFVTIDIKYIRIGVIINNKFILLSILQTSLIG